jgi:hypothetical protein
MSGTWLEETLARAIHEGRMTLPVYGCIHIDREDGSYALCGADAALFIATPAGQSLAARIEALEAAVPEDPTYSYNMFGDRICFWCENDWDRGEKSRHAPDCRWLAVRGGATQAP